MVGFAWIGGQVGRSASSSPSDCTSALQCRQRGRPLAGSVCVCVAHTLLRSLNNPIVQEGTAKACEVPFSPQGFSSTSRCGLQAFGAHDEEALRGWNIKKIPIHSVRTVLPVLGAQTNH